jgi:hypothetical protein
MDFRLIDYSGVLYGEDLPPVREGKFLQVVEEGETELLILSPYGLSEYHAQILERYCMSSGREGGFLRKPDRYHAPGAGIEVIGGGHWKIDDPGSRLELGGDSKVYGRFDGQALAEKIRTIPKYGKYNISIT